MPFPGNTFYRSELEHAVLKELDEHNAVLNGFLSMEHGPDGSHTNITAESITAGLITGNVIANYLRLNPSKAYTLRTPTDAIAFVTDGSDPDVSLWYANSGTNATVNGIYVNDLIRGVPGHLQLIVNNSAFVHTYQSAVVTNATRIYGCATPVLVPPGGVIWFVYDGVNLGWRYAGSSVTSSGGGGVDPGKLPYIVYTNFPNVFTETQTISAPVYPTLVMVSSNYPAAARRFNITGTAGLLYLQATDDPATVDQGHLIMNRVGSVTVTGGLTALGTDGTWTTDIWGKALQLPNATMVKWTKASTLAWGIGQTGDALYVMRSTADDASAAATYVVQFSSNFHAALRVDGGLVCLGSTAVQDPGDGIGPSLRLGYNASGDYGFLEAIQTGVAGKKLRIQTHGATDFGGVVSMAQNSFWCGGYQVIVTGNCSIPGAGGGSSLPPNMAFLNVPQSWSALQEFNAGLTWLGTNLSVYLNQAVRTDSSPTFANATISGLVFSNLFDQAVRMDSTPIFNKVTLNGTTQPDSIGLAVNGRITATQTIEAGNAFVARGVFGLTTTVVIGGVTRTFTGGILTG